MLRRSVRTRVCLFARGGATAFRQWGQDFLFISFTACSPNFSGGNNIVLPPHSYLSGGKLPPLPYGAPMPPCSLLPGTERNRICKGTDNLIRRECKGNVFILM